MLSLITFVLLVYVLYCGFQMIFKRWADCLWCLSLFALNLAELFGKNADGWNWFFVVLFLFLSYMNIPEDEIVEEEDEDDLDLGA